MEVEVSDQVTYMGQLFTSEGLKPDPMKVEAIARTPRPDDKRAVQRLLGRHLTKSVIYLPPFGKKLKSYWPLWYTVLSLQPSVKREKSYSPSQSFLVSSRSAPQEWKSIKTLHLKKIKQNHQRAKPIGWTWAFKIYIARTTTLYI